MRGQVKWFSNEKGYGFITDEHANDYYFAVQDVVGADLAGSGDNVEFRPVNTERGRRATRVRIVAKGKSGDERETCDHCGKKIVPRLVTYQGQVQRSVCPYCGETHQRFAIPRFILIGVAIVVVMILQEC